MARIRSIHPGIYTDEAWASVSIPARWFAKGICTEADDNGVFDWKPLQLKMRIFPADNVDVAELLAELVAAEIVLRFSADGKTLGCVRNFCKFQRPRKPKSWFPITDEARVFTALGCEPAADDDAEAATVPKKSVLTPVEADPVPPKSEKSPQREDGGGRVGEEVSEAKASLSPSADKSTPDGFEACWKAYPHVKGRSSKTKALAQWRRVTAGHRAELLPAVERYAKQGREPKEDCGAPAMERWLRDSRFLDWLEADPTAAERAPWTGPAELRSAVVVQMGEDWTASWLDPCEWDEEAATLVAPRDLTVTHLERSVRRQLVDAKVAQVRVKGRAA